MQTEVQRLNRRQFLVRLGAASATITVVGAGVSALLNSNAPATEVALAPPPNATEEPAGRFPNSDDPVQPAPVEVRAIQDYHAEITARAEG